VINITKKVMSKKPGFISAGFQKNLDDKKYELCALGKSRDLKKSHYKSDIGTKKRSKKLLLSLRTILNLIYMKAIPFLL